MAFDIRNIGRTYLWVCVVAVTLLALPVLKYVVLFLLSVLILPFTIIVSVSKGDYGNAVFQLFCLAAVGFAVYKYFDRILHAAAWVYVVVGDLFKSQTRPGGALSEVVQEGNTMSDKSLKPRGQDDPLERITGNPLETVAQTIKARLATKTAEEMAKALRAKADLYTADNNFGQAMLSHDDMAVELEDENRERRRENKQAELDIKAAEHKIELISAKKKLQDANAINEKTPQQLEAEQFERKRMFRSVDAQDDVFEDFEFDVMKNIELGKQYVRLRDKIIKDKELDEEVRNDLIAQLERQYKANLAREGKGEIKKNASA